MQGFSFFLMIISAKKVPDEVYQDTRAFYDEREYVDLDIINQINSWIAAGKH